MASSATASRDLLVEATMVTGEKKNNNHHRRTSTRILQEERTVNLFFELQFVSAGTAYAVENRNPLLIEHFCQSVQEQVRK